MRCDHDAPSLRPPCKKRRKLSRCGCHMHAWSLACAAVRARATARSARRPAAEARAPSTVPGHRSAGAELCAVHCARHAEKCCCGGSHAIVQSPRIARGRVHDQHANSSRGSSMADDESDTNLKIYTCQ